MHPVRLRARAVVTVASLFAVAVTVVSCDSSDHGLTRAEAGAAARVGAADAAAVLGRAWKPPRTTGLVDAIIAERCGNPRTGLGAPSDGLRGSAVSPALFGDPNFVPTPKVYGNVRSAILVYEDSARAKPAVERLGMQAFQNCMVAAVNTYIHSDPPDREPVPDATVTSFDGSSHSDTGKQETRITSSFEEEVIGGFDNFHCSVLFVARSGAVIVTALAASSGQLLECGSPAALARRLGVSALARAGKAARN
jgi:hypothetical protein